MGKIITLERPESTNSYQVSVAVKSVVAELINSIATPIILEYIASGGKIFAKVGIIENIFVLGITTAFMPPLLRFTDPVYLLFLLRRWYFSDPCTPLPRQTSGWASPSPASTAATRSLPSKWE